MWRWYDSAPSEPRVILCDAGGRLVKSSSGEGLFGSASATGVVQLTLDSSPTVVALGESWGNSPLSVESRGGIYVIDGFEFEPSELQSLKVKRSEFEVFDGGYSRPFGSADSVYRVHFGVDVGFDSIRNYGDSSQPFGCLSVLTPDPDYPDDTYGLSLWVDWVSAEFAEPFVAGSIIECNIYPVDPSRVPDDATVSFGELIDHFPS